MDTRFENKEIMRKINNEDNCYRLTFTWENSNKKGYNSKTSMQQYLRNTTLFPMKALRRNPRALAKKIDEKSPF
jgi:hypothetical protein